MSPQLFQNLIAEFTAPLVGRALGAELATELNHEHGPDSPAFEALFSACRAGVAAGWMFEREGGGIRYGRVIKATPATHNFSVDVVDMTDCIGPHHVHPSGEIDLVMPLERDARLDGPPAGWVVFGPGSGHKPTVSGGGALVLYLLPEGAIQFTGNRETGMTELLKSHVAGAWVATQALAYRWSIPSLATNSCASRVGPGPDRSVCTFTKVRFIDSQSECR